MASGESFEIIVWEGDRSAHAKIKACPACGKPVEMKKTDPVGMQKAVANILLELIMHRMSNRCRR